ncbi:hypothetical protein SAMN02745166_01384 [Prosthecobacter debontii]|uniref:Uncharacterized protein n=1 Tax=Prosthecobacter debontii TaxID=48467 RepID=A0A1T4XFQ2_9BACT|nr:hypothetical protein SAMN02745166_01384 [Prosthecobacter debontii]
MKATFNRSMVSITKNNESLSASLTGFFYRRHSPRSMNFVSAISMSILPIIIGPSSGQA